MIVLVENFRFKCSQKFVIFQLTFLIISQDLIRMGIRNRGHRKRIMMLVDSLPPEDIEQEVPVRILAFVFLFTPSFSLLF